MSKRTVKTSHGMRSYGHHRSGDYVIGTLGGIAFSGRILGTNGTTSVIELSVETIKQQEQRQEQGRPVLEHKDGIDGIIEVSCMSPEYLELAYRQGWEYD